MRRAFTLIEIAVAGLVLSLFAGVAWHLFLGGVKQMTTAGDHQAALRNAVILTHALQQDLRALAVLNHRRDQSRLPILPYSLALSPARTSLRLRVSAPVEALDADPASRFSAVTYQLLEHPKTRGAYLVRRAERNAAHTFEDLPVQSVRFGLTAWLATMECRQHLTLELTTIEGRTPTGEPRLHTVTRQFLLPAPEPPTGGAGGPRGFAFDFPPSTLAPQLAGAVELTGRPGNTDALEPPPDALDLTGKPLPLEPLVPSGAADPFARVEPLVPPLRSQFLQEAANRLEAALGAGWRGSIAGLLPGKPARVPAFLSGAAPPDLRFRLDATGAKPKPLIVQIDELFEKVRVRGPDAVLAFCRLLHMDGPPGTDKPPLEAAALLAREPGGRR